MTTEPVATYRLQLDADLDLRAVAALCDYLAALGVSHCYLSPVTEAVPGSSHGYDVSDPTRVRAELGGEVALRALATEAGRHGLALLVDIVPNHMAADPAHDRWWWETLRDGASGAFASVFDVFWDEGGGRVVLPVLGAPAAEVVARGEIVVGEHEREAALVYHDRVFPLRDGERLGTGVGDPPPLELLDRQHYRLEQWRRGLRELNYRRFFDIADLVAVRIEDPEVFARTHTLVTRLADEGLVAGLRVDHVDGLRDPAGYLARLTGACPGVWILVEKILGRAEELPSDWSTAGTTGYEFAALVDRALVDPGGAEPLAVLAREWTGQEVDPEQIVENSRRDALASLFPAELGRVRHLAAAALGADPDDEELARAVRELVVAFPVYRTYLVDDEPPSRADRGRLESARARAVSRDAAVAPLVGRLVDVLLGDIPCSVDAPVGTRGELRARFQQLTGPVAAKGEEDTAAYRDLRLVSLDEVGAAPGSFAAEPDELHRAAEARLRSHPRSMLATSTHDSKRSEDVRARLHCLAEIPERWAAAADRWREHNAGHRGDRPGPDAADEYLLYQTLVGAWPIQTERVVAYLRKAAREAKRRTSWLDPDPRYEEALESFTRGVLADEGFVADLDRFVAPLVAFGRSNSLAATTLKLTSPGVPDLYQGTELWRADLVDPDNRRPVDFTRRRRALADQEDLDVDTLRARSDEGLPKLRLIARTLRLRRRRPEAFGPHGSYEPLRFAGARARHGIGFVRGGQVAVLVTRFPVGLAGDWGPTTTSLPPGEWVDVLTDRPHAGGRRRLTEVLGDLPVAVLDRTLSSR